MRRFVFWQIVSHIASLILLTVVLAAPSDWGGAESDMKPDWLNVADRISK